MENHNNSQDQEIGSPEDDIQSLNSSSNNLNPSQNELNFLKPRSQRKTLDFIIGIIVTFGWFYIFSANYSSFLNYFMLGNLNFFSSLIFILMELLPLPIAIYMFRNGNKYFALGILSSYLVPLLLFGACYAIFFSFM